MTNSMELVIVLAASVLIVTLLMDKVPICKSRYNNAPIGGKRSGIVSARTPYRGDVSECTCEHIKVLCVGKSRN